MQRHSVLFNLGLAALTTVATLEVGILPTLSQSDSLDTVTFFCKDVYDSASNEQIPATIVWIPERQGNVRLIGWKSEYFEKSGWSPEKRCQNVTQQFQKLYEQGQLNYMAAGVVDGVPIICALASQGEICNSQNRLFTLKHNADATEALQRLVDIGEGKTSEMLLQSSDQQIYVSVEGVLSNAPLMSQRN